MAICAGAELGKGLSLRRCAGPMLVALALFPGVPTMPDSAAEAAQGGRPEKVAMEEMSWTEIRDAIRAGKTTVLLAVGSIEQHGPHLPTISDSLQGKYVAEQAARKLGNALAAPVMQPGLAEHHMDFPGSLTLTFETFVKVLEETSESLARHGFKDIVMFSSHGGNTDTMLAYYPRIAKKLRDRCRVHFVQPGAEMRRRMAEIAKKYNISPGKAGAHAGFIETSSVLAIRPDLVDMSRAERGLDDDAFYHPDQVKQSQLDAFVRGIKAQSPNGILGDARGASAEVGREVLAARIDDLVRTVKRLVGN